MLVIRLNRFGKKNQAAFRVVLQEKTKAPGHRHVEMLGSHNPHTKVTTLNKERILHWIKMGAQPSDRVHNMLVTAGVIDGKKIAKRMKRPEVKAEEPKAAETPEVAPQVETPAETPKVETGVPETKEEVKEVVAEGEPKA